MLLKANKAIAIATAVRINTETVQTTTIAPVPTSQAVNQVAIPNPAKNNRVYAPTHIAMQTRIKISNTLTSLLIPYPL